MASRPPTLPKPRRGAAVGVAAPLGNRRQAVIASEAKQSSLFRRFWIASSLCSSQ